MCRLPPGHNTQNSSHTPPFFSFSSVFPLFHFFSFFFLPLSLVSIKKKTTFRRPNAKASKVCCVLFLFYFSFSFTIFEIIILSFWLTHFSMTKTSLISFTIVRSLEIYIFFLSLSLALSLALFFLFSYPICLSLV